MSTEDSIDWTFAMGRVRGRLIDAKDRDLYRDLYAVPEVMAHIGAAMSVEAATETFQKALRHNRDPAARARYWQITDARCDQTVGMVALIRAAQAPTHAELGVMLLPRWQNRGVGLPALAGVVDGVIHGRWLRDIDRLIGRHAVANSNAGRLIEALCFDRQPDDGSSYVSWWLDRSIWHTRRDAWPTAAGNLRNSPKKES
jgi:RimJ/RimL family protein N-acetyltransferase